MRSGRYLNRMKLMGVKVSSSFQMVLGVFLLVFFGFGVIAGIVDYNDLRKDIMISVSFLLLGAFVVWLSLRKKRLMEAARRYNSLFEADQDGEIRIRALAKLVGKDESSVLKEMDKLISRAMMVNCSLEMGENARVILLSEEGRGDEFEHVSCPGCGADCIVRRGGVGKCEYCGSLVKADVHE